MTMLIINNTNKYHTMLNEIITFSIHFLCELINMRKLFQSIKIMFL